jgi:hypothetical protein
MLHRDKYGIIGQIQPDGSIEGGDSSTFMGAHTYLTNSDFPYVKTFEVSWGAYVRHPDPKSTFNGFGAHYRNPWNGCMSRDQWTGVIGALIRQKERMALLRLIAHHALRGFLFSYNTIHNGTDPKTYRFNFFRLFWQKEGYYKLPDLTLFNVWGMYLRGFGAFSWLFWPILCILDLHLLIDTIFSNKQDDNDQINYALRMMVAREFVPTPTVALAVKILDKQHLLNMLKSYWCGWRDNCDMYPLYEKKIKELL